MALSSPHTTGEAGVSVGRARPRVGPAVSRRAWEREGLTGEGLRRSEPITVGCSVLIIIIFYHLSTVQLTACVFPGYPCGVFNKLSWLLYVYII